MRHRLLFYSHDSFGLGHFRRSLTIASYLVRHIENLTILMVTGLDSAASFEAPPGIDFVKLPGIKKTGPEEYKTRHLRVSFERVHRMRRQMIRDIARSFDPQMFIVDNVPRGVDGELLDTLRYFRKRRPGTRLALTLRDVLDEPSEIVSLWREHDVYEIFENYYDEIWVAGCREVFDVVDLYEFPDSIAARVKFCGYVVRSSPPGEAEYLRRELRLGQRRVVTASCGGGGDGLELMTTFAGIVGPLAEQDIHSVLFLGPDMASVARRDLRERLLRLADNVTVYDYRPDLVSFLSLSSATVSMAGYNTVCEIASLGKPATVVPRVYPRREQALRADAFAAKGMLQALHPCDLTSDSLLNAVTATLDESESAALRTATAGLDMAGLTRITRRVRKNLGLGGAK